jgi:hypothetical protein
LPWHDGFPCFPCCQGMALVFNLRRCAACRR